MQIESISKTGVCHKSNEDSSKIVVNGDLVYSIISDGAGSSVCAKEAAGCVVDSVAEFCFSYGTGFFGEAPLYTAKEMIFHIQNNLCHKAQELSADFSEMMATLVLLCIDNSQKRYVTIHIGDGLIAKKSADRIDILSHPENGVTRQYTFMINSSDVFNHMRLLDGDFNEGDVFISCSDGLYEGCYSTIKYKQIIDNIDEELSIDGSDDITYNIINM